MNISIDGQSDLLSLQPGTQGSGLLEQLENTIASSGRMVSSYSYNGQFLGGDALQAQWDREAPQGQLDIQTIPLHQHLDEQLLAIGEGILDYEDKLGRIGEDLTKMDSTQAERDLAQWCIDISTTCGSLAQLADTLSVKLDAIDAGEESAAQLLHRLVLHCENLTQFLKSGQKVACADLIECDIAPEMPKFKSAIDTLAGLTAKNSNREED